MKRHAMAALMGAGLVLAGCADATLPVDRNWAEAQAAKAATAPAPTEAAPAAVTPAPASAVEGATGGGTAPAALDTATAAERAEATATPAAGGERLGATIASLGDPTDTGFWIKTPLAKAPGKGKIVDPATGKAVNVNLIPLAGDPGAGSQVSLSALRELGVNLTALPEIEVWTL